MAMTEEEKKYKGLIGTLSILVPLAVAALFGIILRRMGFDLEPLYFLLPIYATIIGLTAVCLFSAVAAIKRGNAKLHERLIKLCMVFSSLFLVMYLAYHMTSDSTPYGGEGAIRYVYFFILITHIILSIVIIPM